MTVNPLELLTGWTALVALLLSTAAAPAAAQVQDTGFEVGDRFPEVPLPSLEDGSLHSLSDLRGDKIVLHVFASW